MINRVPLLLVAASLLAAVPAAAAGPPIHADERLVYRVAWAFLPGAGRITVFGRDGRAKTGQPIFDVITDTETRGLARLILPFEAHAESRYAVPSGDLVSYLETSRMRNKSGYHAMRFDYPRRQVVYTDPKLPHGTETLALPPGQPMDLVNCLLQARYWDLQPGQARNVLCFFEDEFYPLTVHAVRRETLETSLGEFQTVVLEPRMELTPPKGMFRRGGSVRVWIAESDPRRLPVQFQVHFKVGTGLATLTEYQLAAAAAPGAAGRVPAGRR